MLKGGKEGTTEKAEISHHTKRSEHLTNLLHSPPVTIATTPGKAHLNYGITLNRNEVSKYLEIYIGSVLVKFPATRYTSATTGEVASDHTQLGRPNQLERSQLRTVMQLGMLTGRHIWSSHEYVKPSITITKDNKNIHRYLVIPTICQN